MKLDRKNVAVANFILLPRASPRVVTLPGGIWGLPGIVVAMHPSNPDQSSGTGVRSQGDCGIERTSLKGD